ncbi:MULTISPECIES: LacI family DNA-binding transcriptional regulator [Enterococcus]|uniref:LacI family DNA-binding transcriptional regulator n=1 Tax=Candidatus Enterococcus murrayae TaxID=2815321 RepID=A0ABS3HD33_9ENTE|nr:LacI family DNA-binding transcriptional regulator [Enterococcus sp. MJM16]MBO0451359.1 LacI family DNA-binding transcriptional regulator [Enterococcus sp. MJM16]
MKKITIRDVAKLANVSVSSVSHVFNHYDDISEETKKKVYEASKELGYVPNSAARSLSSKQLKTVALILSDINVIARGVAMPLEIISGVSDYLDDTEYEFVFYSTNLKKQKEKTLSQFCNEHNISGVIIQGLRTTDPYYEELKHFNLPVVAIDLHFDNESIGIVSVDNERATYEMTNVLLGKGYQNILFLNGDPKASVSHERELGYRKAIKKPSVVYADYSEKKAFDLVFDLYESKELLKYDVVFAASDLMAIGCLKALKELNLINQIALVGFDDITLASYTTPTLTTVRQDVLKIAQVAAENVIEHIETGIAKHSLVDFELIERESAKIF